MKRKLTNASYIIVSSTNTSPSDSFSFESFKEQRQQEGFPDSGWHFVIDRDGGTFADVSVDEVGTHTLGFDSESVGVLLVGGVDAKGKPEANYTAKQLATLNILVWNILDTHPEAKPLGLKDVQPTSKPHFNVIEYFGAIS